MGKFQDLTGKKFYRLTVLGLAEKRNRVNKARHQRGEIGPPRLYWRCKCECGAITIVSGLSLKQGSIKSCGCWKKDQAILYREDHNHYTFKNDIGIGFTNSEEEFYFDKEDYKQIKQYYWRKNSLGYIVSYNYETKENTYLHRLVMNHPNSMVDHIDRVRHNCTKKNLRLCTMQENAYNINLPSSNTSGFIGVFWIQRDQKWRSSIKHGGKYIHLGLYENKLDAIKARLEAEVKYCGEFAPQKHLFLEYGVNQKI